MKTIFFCIISEIEVRLESDLKALESHLKMTQIITQWLVSNLSFRLICSLASSPATLSNRLPYFTPRTFLHKSNSIVWRSHNYGLWKEKLKTASVHQAHLWDRSITLRRITFEAFAQPKLNIPLSANWTDLPNALLNWQLTNSWWSIAHVWLKSQLTLCKFLGWSALSH